MDRVSPSTDFPITLEWNVTDPNVVEIPPFRLNVSYPWLGFYVVVYGTIIIGSLIGNQLVIWSYIIEPKLQKSTNVFIVSLAVADFLTGLIGTPLAVFGRLVTGPYVCYAATRSLFYVWAFMMCSVSIDHLVLITIDRYVAVTRPLKYPRIMTKGKCKILVVIIWIVGTIAGALPVLSPSPNPTLWVCGVTNFEAATVSVHRLISIGFIPFFLCILCLAYLRIFCIARQHVREHSERMRSQNDKQDTTSQRSIMKTTVTTAIVLGAFAICWLPTTAKFIVEQYINTTEQELFLIQTIAEVLSFGNSMVNPIIYTFRNGLFRKTYIKVISHVLCCIKPRKSKSDNLSKNASSTATRTSSIPK